MQGSLKDIMEEIVTTKALAESQPTSDNPSKRRVEKGNIEQAKEKLDDLYLSYRKAVLNDSVFMIVVGSTANKFAESASDKYNTYSYKGDTLFSELADEVPPVLYQNKECSRAVFDHVLNSFEKLALEWRVKSYKPVIFSQKYKKKIKEKEDLIKILKDAFHEHTGTEVVAYDAVHRTSGEAIKTGFDGKVIPIVIYTKDLKFAKQMAKDFQHVTHNIFLIKSGSFKKGESLQTDFSLAKITESGMEKILVNIKKQVI